MQDIIAAGTWTKHYNADHGGKLVLYQCQEKQFRALQEIDIGKSVSILTCDRKNELLFAVCETNYHLENEAGGEIQVYHIEKNAILTFVECVNSYGGFPVGIIILERYIVVLNHGSNLAKICHTRKNEDGQIITEFVSDEANLCLFEREETGKIGKLLDCYIFHGSGKLPVFQESPAPHDLYYSTTTKLLYVPMRGSDMTKVFRIDTEKDQIVLVESLNQREGTGPRNVWSMPLERNSRSEFIYVVSEIEPVITVFEKWDESWKKLQEISIIESLPEDILCSSFEYPHPSGIIGEISKKKIYTINRKPDLLSVFDIQVDGTLKKAMDYPLSGKNPRQMIFRKNKMLIICMDTENIIEVWLDQDGNPIRSKELISGIERIACMQLI